MQTILVSTVSFFLLVSSGMDGVAWGAAMGLDCFSFLFFSLISGMVCERVTMSYGNWKAGFLWMDKI